jgi:tetratricopeptide (TPR) repeat protein
VIAAKSVERALLIKPNDYSTLREKAVVLIGQYNYNEAAALLRRLIERYPQAFRHLQLANILMIQGHFSDALENFITARRVAVGSDSINTLILIAAESIGGHEEEARADLNRFLATPRKLRSMTELEKLPLYASNSKLLEGLRRAGMSAE